jgi:phosphoenolpyruvate carboxykinase (ATP)
MKNAATKSEPQNKSLKYLGLDNLGQVYWDLPTSALYEEAIRRYEAVLSHLGPLVVRTGQYTGRLPKDKFLVREPSSEKKISWGKVNLPLDSAKFDALKHRLCAYLQGKDLFVEDCYAGADEHYRVPIRIISERATGALFARTMFIPGTESGSPRETRPGIHRAARTQLSRRPGS